MIKYYLVAAALKTFSATSRTKRLYRQLGNTVGMRRRTRRGLTHDYVDRAKQIVELCRKHDAVRDGNDLLEIGTGWVHWESTAIRMFYDVGITLFDVWDNRQLKAYKQYCRQYKDVIDREVELDRSDRARRLLEAIINAETFDDIYRQLGFRYVINPGGTLDHFPDESFDLIFSCNVLEHVHRSTLPSFTRDFYRLLKPGGYSAHTIDLCDHLALYDQSAPRKNYLKYSNSTWERYFQNDVQYFNRVQRSEWLNFFEESGLELIDEESPAYGVDFNSVDPLYKGLSKKDLECIYMQVVHQKPLRA